MYPGITSPPPPAPEKKKAWARRHPVWTVISGLAGLIIVLITAGAIAAPGSATSATPAPPATSAPAVPAAPAPAPAQTGPVAGAVGDPLTLSNDTGDIGTITVKSVNATSTPYDQYGEAPKHGEFLIANVRADATGDMSVYEGDFYVLVNGQHYEQGNGNALFALSGDTLGMTDLHAGEHTSGPIVFDIPAGVHGKIVYDPNFDGPPIGSWSF